ncbi:RNA-directed DNA polymerase [Phocaeicola plebeius]|uniref:RNA-directed DNA polymerase n=1 Tax=Phocaeicola plebeius TaxID=310297 RepID=UPI0026E9A9AB|nr:RNA-directed DNA polymerase [Phocaeicola plebeius]MDD6913284.1 RNA-directed DNA polymerase [Phocaeicola plebeius]MDY5978088.1 RNA-directed DNA polymerase [Phocaeicola plebeius]
MGEISLEDVFAAYFACRKRKRGTFNALKFELDYERKCIELWNEINSRTYHPSRSIAFVVSKPVCREVFAADFRDRVVHHLIADRISPLMEQVFIEDSYSTRKGKGTLYGVKRVERFVRDCSNEYTRDCYIMKLDIRSFFMSLDKQLLYDKLVPFLKTHYQGDDLDILLYLIRETIFNRPELNCVLKTPKSRWKDMPKSKSLFYSDGMHGLPIGNLTSQLFALFYLNELDHLILGEWKVRYYGRYVDDMIFVHESKDFLLDIRERVSVWLAGYGLTLHPQKFYLQHYAKGVSFIGGIILPGRMYVSNRTVGYCHDMITKYNGKIRTGYPEAVTEVEHFVSSINSYFGCMIHFSSYNIRKRMMERLSKSWWKLIYFEGNRRKAVVKKPFKISTYFINSLKTKDYA